MTKTRMFMVAALAAISLGVCAHAQESNVGAGPHLRLTAVGAVPAADPSIATQEMIGGPLSLGTLAPTDSNGIWIWPCVTGYGDCSSLPVGGWVSGLPYLTWSSSCSGTCANLTWWFQDGTADTVDHLVIEISIKQGTRIVYDLGVVDLGPNPFPQQMALVSAEAGFGPGWCYGGTTCSKPQTGKATMEATATVGSQTATTKQVIDLQ